MPTTLTADHASLVFTQTAALDPAAGIARLLGDRPLYLRALTRFRLDYGQAGAAMLSALDTANRASAQDLAHTVKGAAAMIQAGALHATASALEQALSSAAPDTEVDAALQHFSLAFEQLMLELDGLALPVSAALAPTTLAPGSDVRERLRALLDRGDGASMELFASARTQLRAQLGAQQVARLAAAVEAFDYERAIAVLDQAAQLGS